MWSSTAYFSSQTRSFAFLVYLILLNYGKYIFPVHFDSLGYIYSIGHADSLKSEGEQTFIVSRKWQAREIVTFFFSGVYLTLAVNM